MEFAIAVLIVIGLVALFSWAKKNNNDINNDW